MKLLDVNILVAAFRDDHAQFDIARPWLDALLTRREPFCVTDLVAASLVRLATSRHVFVAPSPASEPFAFLRGLRAQPNHVAAGPGRRHLDRFEEQVAASDATGDLVPDAQLAAIAVEHNATIVSFDRDFARFRDIRWLNPKDEPPGTRSAR